MQRIQNVREVAGALVFRRKVPAALIKRLGRYEIVRRLQTHSRIEAYGARPLQRNVQDPLAEMILTGEVADGDTVAISSEGNVLTFNGKAPQTAEIAQFEAPQPKRKLH